MTRPRDYANLTEFALDPINHTDPRTAPVQTELVVVRVARGQAQIEARGRKISCDGHMLVLGVRPEEYDTLAGVPILGTGGASLEQGDRPTQEVRLAGLRVLDGRRYADWQRRRSGGRRIRDL